jgi:hypothetical protein
MATKISEHDSITGETIVRDITSGELAQRKLDQAEAEAQAEAQAAKQVAREALLTRLGITAAEAQLLLGA